MRWDCGSVSEEQGGEIREQLNERAGNSQKTVHQWEEHLENSNGWFDLFMKYNDAMYGL